MQRTDLSLSLVEHLEFRKQLNFPEFLTSSIVLAIVDFLEYGFYVPSIF